MDKLVLAKVILNLLLARSPAELAGTYETWPENRETPEEKRERFVKKADVIAKVVTEDTRVKDPVWAAALVLAIERHEGGWTKHVDTGEGPHARGDRGQSVCGMQLRIGNGKTDEGWTAEDVLADEEKCVISGLRRVQRSFGACKEQGPDARLAVYAGGSCREPAVKASKARLDTARAYLQDLKNAVRAEKGKEGGS